MVFRTCGISGPGSAPGSFMAGVGRINFGIISVFQDIETNRRPHKT